MIEDVGFLQQLLSEVPGLATIVLIAIYGMKHIDKQNERTSDLIKYQSDVFASTIEKMMGLVDDDH